METQYRKLQFEINAKDHDEIWLIGKSANFIFNPNTRNGEELFDFLSCCEEITDKTQIEKLEADKAELLEMLERVSKSLDEFWKDEERDVTIFDLIDTEELESLIQKHKQ